MRTASPNPGGASRQACCSHAVPRPDAAHSAAHSATQWATFPLSLRDLVETGKGTPAPDDLQIGNWH